MADEQMRQEKGRERQVEESAEDEQIAEEAENEPEPRPKGLIATFRDAFQRAQQIRPRTGAANKRSELGRDRTRTFFVLAAAVVILIFVFLAMFSSPAGLNTARQARKGQPSLGRPETDPKAAGEGGAGSVTPLLSAELGNQRDPYGDPLTPEDIRSTSRRIQRGTAAPDEDHGALPPPKTSPPGSRQVQTYTRRQSYQPPPPPAPKAPPTGPVRDEAEELSKSSLVFVRNTLTRDARDVRKQPAFSEAPATWTALPPGTRLVARLQSAVSTAVKSPAVAVIEYNYERYGKIVVPAGAKAFGDLEQASNSGHVGIRFHTLSMPDGREEKIQGAGLALDFGPIKGKVSGRNRGKRILVRSLTGIGSMAAFLVGGRGGFSGLSGPLNQSALLRERIASNVAIAGEQELTRLAFNQNIVVTVPGNLRFYIVLEEGAIRDHEGAESSPAKASRELRLAATDLDDRTAIPSVTELRELMALKHELNRIYRDSQGGPSEEPGRLR